MKKKILAGFLSLCMIFSIVPMSVFAASGTGTETDPYVISNVAELKAFRDEVNAGNNYAGKFVKLGADIDLSNEEWAPIGNTDNPFNGTFDGDGRKVSNLVITGNNSNVGFFGRTNNGEIKNLTIENAKVSGRLNVGVVAGTPYTSKYTNINVTGHVEVNGMAYVGGVGGKNAYANWTDITVDADSTSYVNAVSTENGTAYRTYVGGVIGFMGEGSHTFKNTTSNIKVIGDVCDIGGITGIAHYNNKFENVTCTASVVNTNTDADGAAETDGIAGVWHNEAGTSVTFTNCNFTGTVSATGVDSTTAIGAAYNASNNNESNSGSLIVDNNQVWPAEAKIGDVYYKTFAEAATAAQSGDEIKILVAGTYSVPTGKNLTITGAVDGVKFDMSNAVGVHASMTFNNVTFEYGNANYKGLQHAGDMVYNNCTINGQVFLYGTSETFNKCTFNQTSSDAYNVWTYGAKEVAFNECTFNSAGKSVLIYSEQSDLVNDVTVTKSTFNASATVEGKAAIEMDSSLTSGINLTIDGETTATGFDEGSVSGNSLWNNKKGNNTEANDDITVIVDGEETLYPIRKVEAKAPTCTNPGNVEYYEFGNGKYYADENATTELETVVISATDHSWGEWAETTAETCTTDAVETRVCENDASHKETRTGDTATGHTFGEWVEIIAPSCTEKGVETRVCANDSTHKETRDVATAAHTWGYNTQYDAAAHWDHCHICGAQGELAAHSDANHDGYCDCGWSMTSAPGRANPNTGVHF